MNQYEAIGVILFIIAVIVVASPVTSSLKVTISGYVLNKYAVGLIVFALSFLFILGGSVAGSGEKERNKTNHTSGK